MFYQSYPEKELIQILIMKKTLYSLFILLLPSFFYHCYAGPVNLKSTSGNSGTAVLLRMNLYRVNSAKNTVVDGTLTQYGDAYKNIIDGYDARKMPISGENISLFRHDTDLIVERRRTIQSPDTIFFRMWNMQQTNYQMEIVPTNLANGLTAYLTDSYLHTSKELNLSDTNKISFTVNKEAASFNQFRFKIIFIPILKLTSILPFNFLSFSAFSQNGHVVVNWQTISEMAGTYFIERSSDPIHYQPIETMASNSTSNSYQWIDKNPLIGFNYDRIRSVQIDGSSKYSQVVKLLNSQINSGISIYPNPAVGNDLNLKLNNQEAGTYQVIIYNSFGAAILTHQFTCSSANAIVKIPIDKTIAAGIYHLAVINPLGKKQLINILL